MKDSPLILAMKKAYRNGQEDEALEPIVIVDSSGQSLGRFGEGDSVIFYNLRGDREVEITRSLTEKGFTRFPVKKNLNLNFVTMIEYSSALNVRVAFSPDGKIKNSLGEVVSKAGLKMLKIAESEKAIHVGYFINGKNEEPFPGEERLIVSSPPGISSYAFRPEMSASKVSEEISKRIDDPSFTLFVVNLANVDVIGHTEDKTAVLKAVEAVDRELGKIADTCRSKGVTLIVTSDHGTVEEWRYSDGTIHTGHTRNPVPFILADFSSQGPQRSDLRQEGELSDVAPTLLELLGIQKPSEMTGQSLLLKRPNTGRRRRIFLLILDGWGIREEKYGNLIAQARTPNFDHLWFEFPHLLLQASGEAVGMPAHTVGNSEAGHLHLGSGRRVLLDRVKIDKAIEDGSFYHNEAFLWAMQEAQKNKKSLHLLGIVSHYSSHGTIKHLFALLQLAKKLDLKRVFIHALIGRRGERPESGAIYVDKVQQMCRSLSVGRVVTVVGRFWALDREENWDRIEKTYRALVNGDGTRVLIA